ncbi:16S rRNA (cytosine(967)-C(5))-methyltransferase RsmB [Clostridium oryzae]|uniref:16S rRNA (cytosine(967)-C(5))-methyltransferase n=1 Tax=Clostridium oryzae TaxID=1450648 RepID=A0A1V4IQJ7_9CLOT|nr:16S rRNA (cytosine(967)-C(5))-methyltransferase RsmB [Clostridium oryzae]OPJ61757.1 ribosomal RNA small subunit methyltransferase B [Clostridium oryzae]
MNTRKLAVEVIGEILDKGAYSNLVLKNRLHSSELKDNDRALVTEIVYGTIKYKYTIDKILSSFIKNPISKLDKMILNILRISVYQMMYLDKVPDYAIVNEAVNLAKTKSIGASKLVNGVLRNYIRNKEKQYVKNQSIIEQLSFKYSFENWMVKLFVKQYGEENAERIMEGLNSTPVVTVRVNSIVKDSSAVFDELIDIGYNVQKSNVSANALKIVKGSSIDKNPIFKAGCITVQDESAMLAVEALDVKENMEVLDLCAAPGGKTTYTAELMNNTGSIIACDMYEHKLKLIDEAASRLGLDIINTELSDAQKINEQFVDRFDRVLADVPCSGLGIIRKKPEIKWSKQSKDLNELIKIQRNILHSAAKYVKPNGVLVYSTCTLNKNENEKNIDDFLKNNENFVLDEINFNNNRNFIYGDNGMVTILPSDMDGFFIAKLRRKK